MPSILPECLLRHVTMHRLAIRPPLWWEEEQCQRILV